MKILIRRALIFTLVGLVLFAGGFVVWANQTPEPMPAAIAALNSDAGVVVTLEPWLLFEPSAGPAEVGLIFYPGGKVDPRAYAPAAKQIAAAGIRVVILPMPLNLAIFAPDRAQEVISAYPGVSKWVLAGHSLGGAMAARFAFENPGVLAGLAFWAAYPAGSNNLAGQDIPVLSIYGTLDGLASQAEIDASRSLLPADTVWLPIVGGNHAQFGWYGDQAGDNPATITRSDQQDQIVAGMLALFRRIEAGAD